MLVIPMFLTILVYIAIAAILLRLAVVLWTMEKLRKKARRQVSEYNAKGQE